MIERLDRTSSRGRSLPRWLKTWAAGDVTAALVPAAQQVRAQIIAREPAILCGTDWVDATFKQLDPAIRLDWQARDGDALVADQPVLKLAGSRAPHPHRRTHRAQFPADALRTATAAHRYVDAVAGTGCRILDTRKTLPGLRLAQKYAARCGGAQNHRLGLYDMVLLKENHIIAAGSIGGAIATARRTSPGVPVEVEVESSPNSTRRSTPAPTSSCSTSSRSMTCATP